MSDLERERSMKDWRQGLKHVLLVRERRANLGLGGTVIYTPDGTGRCREARLLSISAKGFVKMSLDGGDYQWVDPLSYEILEVLEP